MSGLTTRWSRRRDCNEYAPRLSASVDMTSACQVRPDAGLNRFPYKRSFFVTIDRHTRASVEAEPVKATVDPADIRGLGTTVL